MSIDPSSPDAHQIPSASASLGELSEAEKAAIANMRATGSVEATSDNRDPEHARIGLGRRGMAVIATIGVAGAGAIAFAVARGGESATRVTEGLLETKASQATISPSIAPGKSQEVSPSALPTLVEATPQTIGTLKPLEGLSPEVAALLASVHPDKLAAMSNEQLEAIFTLPLNESSVDRLQSFLVLVQAQIRAGTTSEEMVGSALSKITLLHNTQDNRLYNRLYTGFLKSATVPKSSKLDKKVV